jgi:two-component system cell cycle response regulator DivK
MASKKILVIEDNPINMELTTDLLEAAGYAVIKAETAIKGIELAKAKLPDLILMDIGMPEINGYTAVGILKEDPITNHIPTVALTAFAMKGDKEKILSAGFEGYISKPIDTRAFPNTVASFIKS